MIKESSTFITQKTSKLGKQTTVFKITNNQDRQFFK